MVRIIDRRNRTLFYGKAMQKKVNNERKIFKYKREYRIDLSLYIVCC